MKPYHYNEVQVLTQIVPHQTQMIPLNLPIYIRCLSIPVKWQPVERNRSALALGSSTVVPEYDLQVLTVRPTGGALTIYDPWEMRRDFFALKDDADLLRFLPKAGLFQLWGQFPAGTRRVSIAVQADKGMPFDVEYPEELRVSDIWRVRRLIENSIRKGKASAEIGDWADFRMRLTHHRTLQGQQPAVIVTTTSLLESLLLTVTIDRISGAKVRKCARPDCAVLFTSTSGHERKYCQRYCAHIESVRSDRKRKKHISNKLKGRQGNGNLEAR